MAGTEPNPKPSRVLCVQISKDQAKQLSVGDKVEITVSGEVTGVQKMFDGNEYDLHLENYTLSGLKGNSADKALKEMTGEMDAAQMGKAIGKQIANKLSKELGKNPADYAWDEVRH